MRVCREFEDRCYRPGEIVELRKKEIEAVLRNSNNLPFPILCAKYFYEDAEYCYYYRGFCAPDHHFVRTGDIAR